MKFRTKNKPVMTATIIFLIIVIIDFCIGLYKQVQKERKGKQYKEIYESR
jgi:hypothetical protein